ncbi:multidrug DMT transporter permease, partial [Francisella philomiragia]
MVVLHSYGVAVFFCIITMLCWGSWANTQKLSTKEWPFQQY